MFGLLEHINIFDRITDMLWVCSRFLERGPGQRIVPIREQRAVDVMIDKVAGHGTGPHTNAS
jgi:hypothetical protein